MAGAYATVAEARTSLQLDSAEASATLERLVEVASRRIDYVCGRSFGAPVAGVRVYQCGWAGDAISDCVIDDLQPDPTPTLEVAASEFAAPDDWLTVDGADYRFEPASNDEPLSLVRLKGRHGWLRVTGEFGWSAVPAQITRACLLLTARLYRREQSPLGTVASGGELGDVPIQRYDPDFLALVQSYRRRSIT